MYHQLKYFLFLIVVSLYFIQSSNGYRIEHQVGSERKERDLQPARETERKQRFCLNRLLDALQVVCSHGDTDSIPVYFSPSSEHFTSPPINSSMSRAGSMRKSRHLSNEISPLKHSGKPFLRRRFRRNIVHECCEKPCSYGSLRKYCSPSTRLPPAKVDSLPTDKQQVKNGKLSRRDNETPVAIEPGLSPPCNNGKSDCITNHIDYNEYVDNDVSLPNQCLPFFWMIKANLKKLYQPQPESRKHEHPPQQLGIDRTEPNNISGLEQTFSNIATDNGYPQNTNIPNKSHPAFQSPNSEHDLEAFNSNLLQKQPNQEMENRRDNEIGSDTNTMISSNSIQVSSNIATVRPLNSVISFPRGTNDYIY